MPHYNHIYVNGCSFTGDWQRRGSNQPTYGNFLADHYNATFHNAGKPGSCNRRIIRSTVRDSINLPENTLAVIQLTFLHRTEKYSPITDKNSWKFDFQDYKESVKPDNLDEPENQQFVNEFIKQYNDAAELTTLIADVLMLTKLLESRKIDYIIFALPQLVQDTTVQHEISKTLLGYDLAQNPKVLNIVTNSMFALLGNGDFYYDGDGLNGIIGHLNTLGHQRITEILLSLINSSN